MKYLPRKPPRYTQDNSPYFLTFCTFKRSQLLHAPGIPEFLIEELRFYGERLRRLVAYTIMPDHVHLLVEVEQARSLSDFLRNFKSYTSKKIETILREGSRRQLAVEGGCTGTLTGGQLLQPGRFWQPGTMDHCIRLSGESNDYENHLSYLFFNSYKHLGIAPKNFPYHNFSEFVVQGIFDKDFCSVDEQIVKRYALPEE